VGGLVEPFAFGGGAAPAEGLPSGQRSGTVRLPAPAGRGTAGRTGFFTLGNATSSSSYAPADIFDGITGLDSQGLQVRAVVRACSGPVVVHRLWTSVETSVERNVGWFG
jgi:hypothetical protein